MQHTFYYFFAHVAVNVVHYVLWMHVQYGYVFCTSLFIFYVYLIYCFSNISWSWPQYQHQHPFGVAQGQKVKFSFAPSTPYSQLYSGSTFHLVEVGAWLDLEVYHRWNVHLNKPMLMFSLPSTATGGKFLRHSSADSLSKSCPHPPKMLMFWCTCTLWMDGGSILVHLPCSVHIWGRVELWDGIRRWMLRKFLSWSSLRRR